VLLGTAGWIACAGQGASSGSGADTIADDDSRAEDLTSEGLVEQLNAVAIVLGQANGRLTRIGALVGVSPSPVEIEAAGAAWARAAAIFNRSADLIANADHVPPSPICPAG